MGITQDLFAKKYAISIQREKESEIVVPFEFLSKEEMKTERNMSPRLCCNYMLGVTCAVLWRSMLPCMNTWVYIGPCLIKSLRNVYIGIEIFLNIYGHEA